MYLLQFAFLCYLWIHIALKIVMHRYYVHAVSAHSCTLSFTGVPSGKSPSVGVLLCWCWWQLLDSFTLVHEERITLNPHQHRLIYNSTIVCMHWIFHRHLFLPFVLPIKLYRNRFPYNFMVLPNWWIIVISVLAHWVLWRCWSWHIMNLSRSYLSLYLNSDH